MSKLKQDILFWGRLKVEKEEGIDLLRRHPIDVELNRLSALCVLVLSECHEVEVIAFTYILELQAVQAIHEAARLLRRVDDYRNIESISGLFE